MLPTLGNYSPNEALSWVYPRLVDLEQKLEAAERGLFN